MTRLIFILNLALLLSAMISCNDRITTSKNLPTGEYGITIGMQLKDIDKKNISLNDLNSFGGFKCYDYQIFSDPNVKKANFYINNSTNKVTNIEIVFNSKYSSKKKYSEIVNDMTLKYGKPQSYMDDYMNIAKWVDNRIELEIIYGDKVGIIKNYNSIVATKYAASPNCYNWDYPLSPFSL